MVQVRVPDLLIYKTAMKFVTVTLDTNVLPADDLIAACEGRSVDFKIVTVTEREIEGTDFQVNLKPIFETAIWDESLFGKSVFGGNTEDDKLINETLVLNESILGRSKVGSGSDGDRLEFVLSVISNGGFPTKDKRAELTSGQRRQLRDAMIFEAHVREGRDVFITEDNRGFMGVDGRIKLRLEKEFNTKIMTKKEFLNTLAKNRGASSGLS